MDEAGTTKNSTRPDGHVSRAPTPVVLHVTEAYGGGVATAINDYVRALPEVRHVVAAYCRPGTQIADEAAERAGFVALPAGRWAQLRAIRQTIRRFEPDVIHAHSSYAGVYVRVSGRRSSARIVYSPHCFSFERRDVHGMARAAFWATEAALSFRTDAVATVGEWERHLASRLPGVRHIEVVPHHVEAPTRRAGRADGPIVTVGRIQAQKDPAFFAAAARDARLLGGTREWRWIGGGDERLEALLRESGVTVTGWKRRAEVLAELARAHTYVHTAAWEAGNPIALLEAAAMGLPVVARDIPPIRYAGVNNLVANPIELAQRVLQLEKERVGDRPAQPPVGLRAPGDGRVQADALRSLYRLPAFDAA